MALLLPGGHLGGLGGSADGTGGSVEGVWAPPNVPGGLRWGLETGEIAHLLHRCLSLAFARPASTPWALLDHGAHTHPTALLAELGPLGVVLGCCGSALIGGSL